ncbi:ABC transporter, ATP-binding component [gamma proteobacterium HdN1]|nr:ABC transporter, ATP-binding component [gamma proteobacterium HdN1]
MALALEVRELRKSYANGFSALKGISFDVCDGDFMALLGPNGAGKSTTIGILSSLVRKTSGTVKIFGIDIDVDFSRAKQLVGIVPQEFNFSQFEKASNVLQLEAGYFGIPRALAAERTEKYLHALGLWDKRNETCRMLSGGMKRRLMIARALVHEPRLLILDEPTAGVDIELRRSLWVYLRELNQNGTTIILTTHYLEEAEQLCRTINIIDEGSIVASDTMKGLLARLDKETFILDLSQPLTQPPSLPDYLLRLMDPLTLEVEVRKTQPINALFSQLSAHGIQVRSMRNKANRLEELFVNMLNRNSTQHTPAPAPVSV